MQHWGESHGHKPGWVPWCWVCTQSARDWQSGPGLCFHGGVREGRMGWAGFTGACGSQHSPVRRGGPRCPEAPGFHFVPAGVGLCRRPQQTEDASSAQLLPG